MAILKNLEFQSLGSEAKSILLDLFYPVKSLYMTEDTSFDPNTTWGGTWVQLDGGYSLMTTKKDSSSGYQALSTRADNHTPGNNYQGGLPNITGSVSCPPANDTDHYLSSVSGAFSGATSSCNYSNNTSNTHSNAFAGFSMDASKSSTAYGMYQDNRSNSVIPDHHSVIVWKRTA